MKYERRSAPRAQVSFEAVWDGDKGRNKGEVIDISIGGCFVLSGGIYREKELVKLLIQIPVTGNVISVWGMVANTFPEMGFGLKFTSVSDYDELLIKEIVANEQWKSKEPQVVLPNGHTFVPMYA
jgi:hypothetical protein